MSTSVLFLLHSSNKQVLGEGPNLKHSELAQHRPEWAVVKANQILGSPRSSTTSRSRK